jgi:hypothetical protein
MTETPQPFTTTGSGTCKLAPSVDSTSQPWCGSAETISSRLLDTVLSGMLGTLVLLFDPLFMIGLLFPNRRAHNRRIAKYEFPYPLEFSLLDEMRRKQSKRSSPKSMS